MRVLLYNTFDIHMYQIKDNRNYNGGFLVKYKST